MLRMGRSLLVVVALGLTARTSLAGTVGFGPTSDVAVRPGEAAVFEISIADADEAFFDAVDLALSASPRPDASSFVYAETFLSSLTLGPPPQSCSLGPDCVLFLGGLRLDEPAWQAPLILGTWVIDTTGLSAGDSIDLAVDAVSALSFHGESEALTGQARINIVPEPGTGLLLLGLGLARRSGRLLTRRQRNACALQWGPCGSARLRS